MLEQAIQRAVESWVERGRDRNAIAEGNTFVLRYGRRFRIQTIVIFCIFAFVLALALITPRLEALLLSLFWGFTLLATFCLVFVLTSRVAINDERVSVRCFGITVSECKADDLVSAYRSPVHASIVLVNSAGRKTRISTQFDGLTALVAWLWLRPNEVLTESIRKWMRSGSPDLEEPSNGPELDEQVRNGKASPSTS